MITLNQTAGNNNESIWVLKINTPTPIYLSTRDLTLDSTFDGQVLNYQNYLTDLTYDSSIANGGGTGAVTSFGFSISRYVNNSSFADFFNEFYPATSGVYLTSQIVQLGICWVGATADTDITWLFTGRIIDYQYEQRKLNITVFQESEITNKEIPYYSVQKDFDNGISYFPNAPEENLGKPIPIVYGEFSVTDQKLQLQTISLSPAVVIDLETQSIALCSHEISTAEEAVYKYVRSLGSYLRLTTATVSAATFNYGYTIISLFSAGVEDIDGFMYIKLTNKGVDTTATSIINTIDRNSTNYSDVDTGEKIGLKTSGTASTSEVGWLSITDADIKAVFNISSNNVNNRTWSFSYYNYTITSGTGDTVTGTHTTGTTKSNAEVDFGNSTNAKRDGFLPWSLEEVTGLDYVITNTTAGAGNILRVFYGYLRLNNIKVQGIFWQPTTGRLTANGQI